jgi:S1-C subfamily serine protease
VRAEPALGPRRGRRNAAACLIAAIVALAASVALAACGGDEDGDTTTTVANSGEASSAERVVVEAQRGAFAPQAIYEKAAPGVVTVLSTFGGTPGIQGLFGGGPTAGQGSGFVISSDGEIATNAHVVTDAETAGVGGEIHEADQVFVQFADRNRVPADVVGFDPFADVALLKVDPEGLDLVPLEFDDSEEVAVGDPVAAIGSPFGQEQSLSIGVVSATDRSIESLTRFQIDGAIQTDASINPGNSGGPLLDAAGRIIGINQQINTSSGGDQGVGFAVPSNLVARSLDQLRDDGEANYAYIGVTSQTLYPQLAERLELPSETGSMVAKVVPGSPADDAGLQAGDEQFRFQGQQVRAGGDVIVAVDGKQIVNDTDLPALIAQHRPGDTVTLEVLRDGETQEIEVELEERPEGSLG